MNVVNRQSGREREFSFIDLFAGIGGMRLPFEERGGVASFASDIDRFARITYQTNFGDKPYGDIQCIKADQIPAHDILLAGFPCQPFSLAGVSKYLSLGREHGFKDQTKGTLFFDIVRILEYHRPAAFLLENVRSLMTHDQGETWEVISGALNELGYFWDAEILDAQRLVPQRRKRVFIVGFRDRVTWEWPEIPDLRPQLSDILDTEVDDRYTLSDKLWAYLQEYAVRQRRRGNGFGFGLASADGVSRTLSARYYKDGAEILIPQDGRNPRRLTPRECARLMGFPDSFVIPVSDTQAYRQFGNSVVIPLVRLIADSMVESLTLADCRQMELTVSNP